jgi:steroid delta-isomerase-like uncharacterized protein
MVAAAENERMIRRSVEAWNRRDFGGWQAPLAPDVQVVVVAEGRTLEGAGVARDYAAGWATAFPDATLEISDVIASPEGVSLEFVFRGTHKGPLNMPAGVIEATGRKVEARGCWTYVIEHGKARRARSYYDGATIMRQLGLLK